MSNITNCLILFIYYSTIEKSLIVLIAFMKSIVKLPYMKFLYNEIYRSF